MHEGRRALASAAITLWVGGQLGGCHAQVKARAEMSSAESDDRRWEEPETASTASPEPPAASAGVRASRLRGSASSPSGPAVALVSTPSIDATAPSHLAVVHDLALASTAPRTPVCRCLALAHGSTDDARFAWQSERPHGDALAIAISDEGVPCTARHGAARHASIAGVGREGDDVVLTVEGVREGVPVVRGAVVTRPPAGARLVVRARGAVPYGLAPTEAAPCRVELR